MPDEIKDLAEQIMAVRKFSDLSGFLQQLIREEHERRHGPMVLAEGSGQTAAAVKRRPESPARYRVPRKKAAADLTDREKS